MTYYVIKFVWKDSYNFVQTTYAGYDRIGSNWWPSPRCDFHEAEKFNNIEAAKNFYEKAKNFYEESGNFFNPVSVRENSSTFISKIVINTEDVEKI